MSGHSKWSKIKRKKAETDNKRGKIFSRYLREIQVAAGGGGDLDGNPRLKRIVDSAKSAGVPSDNITKAIKRGTGDIEGEQYEEVSYEAYGPAGIGIIIKTLTDNKTRTVSEVRHVLSRNNGSLASTNAVAYQFNEKSVFTAPKSIGDEDQVTEFALDAGADDLSDQEDVWEIYADASSFDSVFKSLEVVSKEITGELRMIAENTIDVPAEDQDKVIALLEALDDLDDVQDVYSNLAD